MSRKEAIRNIERRISELEQRLDALKNELSIMRENISDTLTVALELSDIRASIRYQAILGHLDLEHLKATVKRIKEFIDFFVEKGRTPPHSIIAEMMSWIISISRVREIPFRDLFSMFIEQLGKETLKKIIKEESVLKFYGEESAVYCKKLLE